MRTYLTYEQLDALIRFAEDDKTTVDVAAIEALSDLNYHVQMSVTRHLNGAWKRNRMLQERMDKIKERTSEKIEAGVFEETNRDSYAVARALLYQLQQLRTYKLSKYKVNAILYEMYASWLYSKRVRLFQEHPVAAEWGPMLWHAVKKLNVSEVVSQKEWAAFASENPAVAAFCKNAAQKYYDIAESTLTDTFKATVAYKNASAEKNGGKWSAEITDKDIYAWKKHQDEQNRRV